MGRKRVKEDGGEEDDVPGALGAPGAPGAPGAVGAVGAPGAMGCAGGMGMPMAGAGGAMPSMPGMAVMPGMAGLMGMMGGAGMMGGMPGGMLGGMMGAPQGGLLGAAGGLPQANLPAAFRRQAEAAAGGGMPGGLPGVMATNPLLAMTASANPMMAMAMMGATANAGGIAGNIAVPKPAQPPKPAEPQESTAPDPDIVELFDYFHIDPRHLSRFSNLMEKREETFAGDMLKLWELLEQARSPEGMLVSKMREMETGTFIGKTVPDEVLLAVSKKFRLDAPAEAKLSDVMAKYDPERRREYMKEVEKHLETSAKPSATVMMLLKKLGEGLPLGKPSPPAPGCYLDRQKRDNDDRRRPREDGYRPRSPAARRDRDRDGDRRDDRERRDGGGAGSGGGRERRDRSRDRERRE